MKDLAWKLIARFLSQPAVAGWLYRRALKTPYTHIEKDGSMYMQRYWLFNPYALTPGDRAKQSWLSKRLPSARIHIICREDRDHHLHSHPWDARTIILANGYTEERLVCYSYDCGEWTGDWLATHRRQRGDTATLKPTDYHRITQLDGGLPVTTLFITWEYAAKWGFRVDGKHVPYREYLGLDK